MIEPGSIEHLTQVISHVVAPAFLLSAVAGFVALIVPRREAILERIRTINDLPETGHSKSALKADLPRLKLRVRVLGGAVYLAVWSGVVDASLIVLSFAAALLSINHVWLVAVLFIVSMVLICALLALLAYDTKISVSEHDFY